MNAVDLTNGNIIKKIMIVAIPAILTTLMQMLYNLVDMYFISFVGNIGLSSTDAISAVGTGGYFLWITSALVTSYRVGVDSLVPQEVGRKNEKGVNKVVVNALIIATSLTLIMTLCGLFLADEFVSLFNFTSEKVILDSEIYIKIIALGFLPQFLNPVFSSTLNGFGRSKNAFIISAIGLVLNIILDPIMIISLELGVRGAAIATIISQYISLLIFILYFYSKARPIKLHFKNVANKKEIIELLKLGVPVAVQSISFSLIGVVQGIFIASFGEAAVATSRIGSQIEQLSWLVGGGFMVSFASFIGQNIGAKKYDRVKEGFYKGSLIVFIYGVIITFIMLFFGHYFFVLLHAEEQVLYLSEDYIKFLSFSLLLGVFEGAMQGAFSGISQTKNMSLYLLFINFIRIPLAYLLMPHLGLNAIWLMITICTNLKGGGLLLWFIIKLKKGSYKLDETTC